MMTKYTSIIKTSTSKDRNKSSKVSIDEKISEIKNDESETDVIEDESMFFTNKHHVWDTLFNDHKIKWEK